MATYVPNAATVTEPTASREVGSAAEEFRVLKTYTVAAEARLDVAEADVVDHEARITAAEVALTGIAAGTDSTALAAALASTSAGLGAALVGVPLTAVATAINTVDWALKIVPDYAVSVLRYIAPSEWAAILAGTSTFDASTNLNAAIAANPATVLPAGCKFLCKSQVVLGRGKELFGYGRSSQLLIDFTTPANFPGLVGVAVYTNSLPSGDNVNEAYGRTLQGFSVYGVNNAALTGNATTGVRFYANRSLNGGGYDANDRDDAVFFSYIGTVQNVHVRRFDTAFDLAEVWHSKFIACVAAESRIGIRVKGKSVDVQFIGCDITTMSTSYTPTAGSTYGYYIDNDVYAGPLNGWPEGIMVQNGMAVGGLTYSAYLAGSPFQVGFYGVTMDSVSANVYVAGTVQDFRVVGCNATIRSDAGACIDFAATTDSSLSHAAIIHGNMFDCQAPTVTNADGIRYPTTNNQRYAQTITDNRFRNAFRYCINGGGAAGSVGGFGYSTVTGNKAQQQVGGALIALGYSGQYSLIEGNTQSAGVRVLSADNAPATAIIGLNQSSVQTTGKAMDRRTSYTITAVDQTFELAQIDYLSLYEHSTLVMADVTIRGSANYTRRWVFRISYTSVFSGTASSVTTDANYTFDQSNANYALTFSPAVVVNSNQSFSLNLTIRSTGAILIGAAEVETKLSVVTPKENLLLS